jgi:hypothetical protein
MKEEEAVNIKAFQNAKVKLYITLPVVPNILYVRLLGTVLMFNICNVFRNIICSLA